MSEFAALDTETPPSAGKAALDPARSRDCIMISTADWRAPYWTNKQHMAQTMSRRGWRICYVESTGLRGPRLGSGRDWGRLARRLLSGLRSTLFGPAQVAPNIWMLSPLVVPGKTLGVVGAFNQAALSWGLRRFCAAKGFERPMLWTYHPYMLEQVGIRRGAPLVYHCVDDIAAIPGVDSAEFERAERLLLEQSDVVFATAPALAEKCRAVNANTYYLPNVVDADHFGQALRNDRLPADLVDIPGPRLLYYGSISAFKLDLPLLYEMMRGHPEWHLVLIGDEPHGQHSKDVAKLRALTNVHWLGYRPYVALPGYLAGIDVGLLPTVNNAYTQAMFPMKFYEYLAAGVPIATSLAAFAKTTHAGVEFGEGVDGLAEAIGRQLTRGRLAEAEAVAAVGPNTWEQRLDRMEAALDVLDPRTVAGAIQ